MPVCVVSGETSNPPVGIYEQPATADEPRAPTEHMVPLSRVDCEASRVHRKFGGPYESAIKSRWYNSYLEIEEDRAGEEVMGRGGSVMHYSSDASYELHGIGAKLKDL
ncbi:hypothetical protein KSP39_PZI014290 [Platanthera zijinensis]|uniref:Uncharacterized protein n=1 Tax=Platanthera zijinensis TaxID=2320716 RepID=A0AAP0G1V9_9ASPA